jgi:hypothetical protein
MKAAASSGPPSSGGSSIHERQSLSKDARFRLGTVLLKIYIQIRIMFKNYPLIGAQL